MTSPAIVVSAIRTNTSTSRKDSTAHLPNDLGERRAKRVRSTVWLEGSPVPLQIRLHEHRRTKKTAPRPNRQAFPSAPPFAGANGRIKDIAVCSVINERHERPGNGTRTLSSKRQ
jgi:hypothetical protein